jgi:DNA invertase Pin-like site-specific DNA recombinase
MNVALYARVSTKSRPIDGSEPEGQTLDPQWIELRAEAARRGWTVVEECSDVMSGGRASRPGLDRVVALASEGRIAAVSCVKIDRIARSMSNFCVLIRQLKEANCALVVTGQNIDTSQESPHGELMMNMLMCFAQFERGIIRDRVMAGLEAAKAKGKKLGRPSAKLLRGADAVEVVRLWRTESAGYIELGRRLGGVSAATAWRAEKRMIAAGELPAKVVVPGVDLTDSAGPEAV